MVIDASEYWIWLNEQLTYWDWLYSYGYTWIMCISMINDSIKYLRIWYLIDNSSDMYCVNIVYSGEEHDWQMWGTLSGVEDVDARRKGEKGEATIVLLLDLKLVVLLNIGTTLFLSYSPYAVINIFRNNSIPQGTLLTSLAVLVGPKIAPSDRYIHEHTKAMCFRMGIMRHSRCCSVRV